MKYLVILELKNLSANSPARNETSGDEIVVWSTEIIQSEFEVGDLVSIAIDWDDPSELTSLNVIVDEAIDGMKGVVTTIFSPEESEEFLHVHRPAVGELR